MNYGGFGSSLAVPSNGPQIQRSNSVGGSSFSSKFGGFTMAGTASKTVNKLTFNPVDQFRVSLSEVMGLKPNEHDKIYKNSVAGLNMPNQDYLKSKRGSVFHKAFDSGAQASTFVPPVHAKD
jgi:hypothetical protein